MNEIRIEKATLNELDQLQTIGRQTFAETFSAGNSPENLRKYVDESFATEKLKTELSNENSEFYFARLQGEVIAYLKLNVREAQTELKAQNALEIERIYVLKAYHGSKVGQLLYEKAVEVAERKGSDYVWLGVWEENPRAIRFYQKNGFVAFDKHIFRLGNEEQTDIMMKLPLKESNNMACK